MERVVSKTWLTMTLSRISVRRARIETPGCLSLDLFLGGNERDDEVRPMMAMAILVDPDLAKERG